MSIQKYNSVVLLYNSTAVLKMYCYCYCCLWAVSENQSIRIGLTVENETQNRRAGKHPVATSALKLCNNGWHADGHPP